MRKETFGKCAICGKYKKLTFEHIPPKSAHNDKETKVITGDSFIELMTSNDRLPWETDGLKYEQMHRGSGLDSICEECNNFTGASYGAEYCHKSNVFVSYISRNNEQYLAGDAIKLTIKNIYPLRFIKQVLSMFCSTTTNLSENHNNIRELVLNKDLTIDNPNFKVRMYLVKNQIVSWTGPICMCIAGLAKPRMLSEIVAFPFGFVFDYDNSIKDERMLDITSFLSYKYDENVNLELVIPILERNDPMPVDFRTKEAIVNTINENTNKKSKMNNE